MMGFWLEQDRGGVGMIGLVAGTATAGVTCSEAVFGMVSAFGVCLRCVLPTEGVSVVLIAFLGVFLVAPLQDWTGISLVRCFVAKRSCRRCFR